MNKVEAIKTPTPVKKEDWRTLHFISLWASFQWMCIDELYQLENQWVRYYSEAIYDLGVKKSYATDADKEALNLIHDTLIELQQRIAAEKDDDDQGEDDENQPECTDPDCVNCHPPSDEHLERLASAVSPAVQETKAETKSCECPLSSVNEYEVSLQMRQSVSLIVEASDEEDAKAVAERTFFDEFNDYTSISNLSWGDGDFTIKSVDGLCPRDCQCFNVPPSGESETLASAVSPAGMN